MTQTVREQLQALVDELNHYCQYGDTVGITWVKTRVLNLMDRLAAEPPAVTVRAGWYAKDFGGFWYFAQKPVFMNGWWVVNYSVPYDRVNRIVNDPWAESHPNGGPECCMEVK